MSDSIWFRLGYALERARGSGPPRRLRALTERDERRSPQARRPRDQAGGGETAAWARDLGLELLARAGADRRRPDLRAALAGALAAGTAQVVRALMVGDPLDGDELKDDALRGAAVGMIYGAFIDPWLPGPLWVRGGILGLASYTTRPLGGLTRVLGPLSPHRRLPVGAALFDVDRPEPDTIWEHVLFGVALAAFYRSSRDRSGISSEE